MAGNKIVKIEWEDSKSASHDWEDIENIEPLKLAICVSVGFIFEETKDYITIVPTVSERHILGRLSIPRKCIKKQRSLR